MPVRKPLTKCPLIVAEQLQQLTGLSDDECGELVHVTGRMWRYYKSRVQMPLHILELFILRTGLATLEQVINGEHIQYGKKAPRPKNQPEA